MHSPQLLMLSSIGPNETLTNNGIPIVSALEGVGQNMHDSCAIGGISFDVSVQVSGSFLESEDTHDAVTTELLSSGTGPLINMGNDSVGWEKLPASYRANFTNATASDLAAWPEDWPGVEIVLGGDGVITGLLVTTTSRGHVTINSSSVEDQPVIQTNWLTTETDQQVAAATYRRMAEIISHLTRRTNDVTSPNATTMADDKALLAYIQNEGISDIPHGSSTCRMGRDDEEMAVWIRRVECSE